MTLATLALGAPAASATTLPAHTTPPRLAAATAHATHYHGCVGGSGWPHYCSTWAIPAVIVNCESWGRDFATHATASSGFYQIAASTWNSYGGQRFATYAFQATRAQQAIIAARIWWGEDWLNGHLVSTRGSYPGKGAGQWTCTARVGWSS